MNLRVSLLLGVTLALGAFNAMAAINPALPSIFIAGDSTAADGVPDAIGWGRPFPQFFDTAKMNVVNEARGGRSSRTFVTEGLWDKLLADVKPHDYVIIQFGHNDGGDINGEKIARGSLPGLGEETQEIDNNVTKQHEIVHTFGWYMRKMIADTKAKGAVPILFSLTVRNIWKDGHVERGSGHYGEWTQEIAKSENATFVDFTNFAADHFEQLGEAAMAPLYPKDHTHTNDAGAELNARMVIALLKATRENAIIRNFSAAGRAIEVAPMKFVTIAAYKAPAHSDRENWLRWLNQPQPADPALPSIILIGDSTIRNGRGDAINGQWGWGDPLAAYFDPAKVNVVNRAVGGTGVMSFMQAEFWESTLPMIKPGDVVIMQFGHNDNGPAAPLHGVGEETEERTTNGKTETVHTWGWYLRKYIADIRSKGATPVVCTLIPRNIWENGKIQQLKGSHADWAREVAKGENVPLLDLYHRIAERYDPMGETAVTALFADKRVHTTKEGAEINAGIVVSA
ncbi:MAG TPA: rhamnogalacturonan acetylesterase, partial [Bryobacteraceae bacterium]|nr:rhamnogalacturonan acetylesterase [Bryobacteraceae bacterium]